MEALEKSADDSGWAHLGTFGSYLQKIQPDFDSRLYGFKKLSDLVRGRGDLFVNEERTGRLDGSARLSREMAAAKIRQTSTGDCSSRSGRQSPLEFRLVFGLNDRSITDRCACTRGAVVGE